MPCLPNIVATMRGVRFEPNGSLARHVLSASLDGSQRSIVVDQERMSGGSVGRCVLAPFKHACAGERPPPSSSPRRSTLSNRQWWIGTPTDTTWASRINTRRRLIIVRPVRSIHTRCANATSVLRLRMCSDDNTRPRLLLASLSTMPKFVTSAESQGPARQASYEPRPPQGQRA
jgi:hypothetical protein